MPSFIKSVSYAVNGLKIAFSEKHVKIHLIAAIVVITAGLYFHITVIEWCILLFCIGIVLALEIINTAIEHFVNLNLLNCQFNELTSLSGFSDSLVTLY